MALFVCTLAVMALHHDFTRIDLYTHQGGKIKAKTIDDITTLPLHPMVDTIQGIEHYYMLPHMLEEHKKSTKNANNNNNNNNHHHHHKDKDRTKNNHQKKNFDMILDHHPKGIFIFLHSCKRSGLEFFHLPEDRIVAYDALRRGLAVLAVSSQHRDSGCWTEPDIAWVGTVIDEWARKHDLEDEATIPRIAMAVSSAASFLFFVYDSLRLQAMAIVNSPLSYDAKSELVVASSNKNNDQNDDSNDKVMTSNYNTHDNNNDSNNNVAVVAIPTVFVTMPKDDYIAKEMERNYKRLGQAGVPTQLFKVRPIPFTTEVCNARIPELGKENCDKLLETIRTDYPRLLDADGFVKEAMKSEQWKKLFTQLDLEHLFDQPDTGAKGSVSTSSSASSTAKKTSTANYEYYLTPKAHNGHSWLWAVVEEEFATCLAYHSMTAEHHGAILDFMMQQAGISTDNDDDHHHSHNHRNTKGCHSSQVRRVRSGI
jgi:hypothetical protein